MFNAEEEQAREIARREAAVIEAAREWAKADEFLQRRNEEAPSTSGAGLLRMLHIASRNLHAAVAALEELTGPLTEVQL